MSNESRWYEDWVWADDVDNDYNQYADILGYTARDMEEAFNRGHEYGGEKVRKDTEQYIDQLKSLIAANVRVIKEEIKKELSAPSKDNS